MASVDMGRSDSISERMRILENILRDPDEGVRQKAAESLSRIEAMVNFGTYVSMLDSDDRAARIQAIYLLGELATEEAVRLLQSQMSDPYDDVRAGVIQALGNNADSYRARDIREKAVDIVLMGLGDLNLSIRASAADALAKFKDTRSAAPLLEIVKDTTDHEGEDVQLTVSVILALGEIGDRRAVPDIIEKTKIDNPDIREAALKALGMMGDPRAEGCLIESLTSDNPRIRMQAAESLGRI